MTAALLDCNRLLIVAFKDDGGKEDERLQLHLHRVSHARRASTLACVCCASCLSLSSKRSSRIQLSKDTRSSAVACVASLFSSHHVEHRPRSSSPKVLALLLTMVVRVRTMLLRQTLRRLRSLTGSVAFEETQAIYSCRFRECDGSAA